MTARQVWKYSLFIPETVVPMPACALLCDVQMQHGDITIWAEVDPEAAREPRTFRVVGTGHPFDGDTHEYVGTVQDGPLVWHIFEV